jgi:Cu-processing system ATP-binding protein
MSETVVALQQVSQYFGAVQALRELSFTLAAGEVLALLGHNGAGKTTSIKLILGLLTPTHGSVRVLGEDPAQAAQALRLRLGYLPESVSFYQQLSGLEALRYFARLKQVPLSRCPELLEQVGLQHAMQRRIKTYSKGMRQRLGLAQALLRAPALLLLDEPTVGLDPLATADFFATVQQLRQQGSGIILCSHVLAGLEKHLDRVAILAQGQLRAYGSVEQLRVAADLPWRIEARGDWQQADLVTTLEALGAQQLDIVGSKLRLVTELAHKLPLARFLLNQTAVDSIELLAPSLEHLYAHYNRHEALDHA